MAKNSTDKEPTTFKATMTVVAFIVSLIFMFTAAVVANQYRNIRPYKTLASELNDTLGGGYKITYTWNCGLESSNCPSARMIKDADFKSNDEAETLMSDYASKLNNKGFVTRGVSVCEPRGNLAVYCTLEAKKNGLVINMNAKQDFIGIDIQP